MGMIRLVAAAETDLLPSRTATHAASNAADARPGSSITGPPLYSHGTTGSGGGGTGGAGNGHTFAAP